MSTFLIPVIQKHVKACVQTLTSTSETKAFAKVFESYLSGKTIEKANTLFFDIVADELHKTADLQLLTEDIYLRDLETFLSSPYVQDELQRPLDGESDLDYESLRRTWAETTKLDGQQLFPLPSKFNWRRISMDYRASVKRCAISDARLRPAVLALATLNAAEFLKRTASAAERIAGPPKSLDLQRYAEATASSYAYLNLGSLSCDWTVYENRLPLENVYVPQCVKSALPPADITPDYIRLLDEQSRDLNVSFDEQEIRRQRADYEGQRVIPLMNVVNDPARKRLIILGGPGLGKSTLLKLLALRWARRPADQIAVLIELRRASAQSTFLDYLEEDGQSPGCGLPRVELDQFLRNHSSLFLFDGLDEVPEGKRDAIVMRILSAASTYPKARVIVTTRIYGYHPGSRHPEQFRDADFEQFTLQDFKTPETNEFIRRWHLVAFSNPEERHKLSTRLLRALDESHAIRELAANPLLLTMMAILNRVAHLPRDRHRLYERCAELLLQNWELEKFPERKESRGSADITDRLGSDQKMRVLGRVAVAMQQDRTSVGGNLISEEKLRNIVEAELRELGVERVWAGAQDLMAELRKRTLYSVLLEIDNTHLCTERS